jgi:hypothetical protein
VVQAPAIQTYAWHPPDDRPQLEPQVSRIVKDYLGNPGCLGWLIALLLTGAIAVVAVISSTDGQTPSGSGALPAGSFPPAPTSAPPLTRPATIGCTDATDEFRRFGQSRTGRELVLDGSTGCAGSPPASYAT